MHGGGDAIGYHSSNSSNPSRGSGLRILVVDDDADTVESTAILLEQDGHEVQRALSGRAALECVGPFSPHLALIDLAMPDMGGLDVARGVREMNLQSQPTLAAVTGNVVPEYKRLCAEAGFDHYLVKPVPFTELSQVVQLAIPSDRFEALKVKCGDLAYDIVVGHLEFCGLVLDWAAKLRDVSAQRRHVDKVLRTELIAATWLGKHKDLTPDQRIKLEIQIASVGVRMAALSENMKT